VPSQRYYVFTAIRAEADAIARTFGLKGPRHGDPVEINWGRVPTSLFTIGMGAVGIPDLSGKGVAGIIMAGLAGALDPQLKVGDIVVDQSSSWRGSKVTHRKVWFHSVDHPVVTPEEKRELFGQTGASVVEMENQAVKKAAKAYGIPFLGIRAISDTAAEAIDPAVLDFVDPYGKVRMKSQVRGGARRPSLIKELRRLSRASTVAVEALAKAMHEILALKE
jgi:nucleoside phosphorylase